MMLLAILSPLIALGLMLLLQVLETRVLEARPATHGPRGRQPEPPLPERARTTPVSGR